MKRIALATALAALTAFATTAQAAPGPKLVDSYWSNSTASAERVDHSAWNAFLGSYLRDGSDGVKRVDYAGVSAGDRAALSSYLDRLQAIDPTTLGKDAQFAYWLNMYNALTIDVVLGAYPVDTIKKIDGGLFNNGPWGEKRVTVAGRALSLDDIEHGILRPIWGDPRIHYGVNCASIGCPDLPSQAFTADNLNAMLDAGARAYVNHPRGVTVQGDAATVSSIYEWFKVDFGGNNAGILAHLKQYATGSTASALSGVTRIGGDIYDWSLNDAR